VRDLTELEAALRVHWDPELASVYADALAAAGDPRGELIAIDLDVAKHGSTAEHERRHAELVKAWLGLSESPMWKVRDGIIDLHVYANLDELRVLEASPGAPYFGELGISGDTALTDSALLVLTARARPWLTRIMIARDRDRVPAPISSELGDRLVGATPNLGRFRFVGSQVFERFAHPTVRAIEVCDTSALRGAGPFPAATSLALWFTRPPERDDLSRIDPARFPAVRRLDVARYDVIANGARGYGVTELARYVRELGIADQLEHVHFPAPRSTADDAALQATIDASPRLRTVAIARTSRRTTAVRSTRVAITTPPPGSWPLDDVWFHALRFELADEIDVYIEDLQGVMESCYDRFSPAERAAWDAFWTFVIDLEVVRYPDEFDDGNVDTAPRPFTPYVLVELLEACGRALTPELRELRERLRTEVDLAISRHQL